MARKLWPIEPLTKMWGINKRTEAKLNKKGIFRVGDLANYPVSYLKRDFGVIGVDLHLHANGIDESILKKPYKARDKSLGKSQILMRDHSMNELKTVLIEQIDEVFFRVRNQQAYPTRISVNVGYADIGGVRKQFSKKDVKIQSLKRKIKKLEDENKELKLSLKKAYGNIFESSNI